MSAAYEITDNGVDQANAGNVFGAVTFGSGSKVLGTGASGSASIWMNLALIASVISGAVLVFSLLRKKKRKK